MTGVPAWRVAMALAATALLVGCANHVVPPAEVEEPTRVFLLDHGRHTSLVVSTPEGGLVRYAYGDWRFYAERKTGLRHATAALLWRTPGALGRRELRGPPTAEAVRARIPLVIVNLYALDVEQASVAALRDELDAMFSTAEQTVDTPETDLIFVPHPRAYTLRHNSNTAIAGWLTQLGCEVRGPAIIARWRIEQTAKEAQRL